MDAHVRIGDNRVFSLKQAVLLYQEGSRTFATLHEVKFGLMRRRTCAPGSLSRQVFLRRSPKAWGQAS